jgi:hypothetical protein
MTLGSPRKFDFARQIAAAVGYVALCGFDRVSIFTFPENAQNAVSRGGLRAVRGRKSALTYFQNISGLEAKGVANFNEALKRGSIEARQAGVAIVLSDFLDPAGYESGLSALISRGFHVNAIQILSPEEINPATFGDLRMVDSETGAMQEVTFGKYRLKNYQQTVENFCQRLREYCQSRGVNFFGVGSDTSLEKLLLNQLRQAEVWG